MTGSHIDQITALVHRYAELLDAGDLDGVAALFARATWRTPGGPVRTGADEVRRMYDPVRLYDGRPLTRHVVTNLVVEVDDAATTASARSYWTLFQATPDLPLQAIMAGSYHDRFEHEAGRWRFADRMIVPELIGDLSHHYDGPIG